MLRINSISNVNNTLKRNAISFGTGVRTNYGVKATNDNLVEGGVLTGFVGILKESPLISSRAQSIQKGIDETKLNVMA